MWTFSQHKALLALSVMLAVFLLVEVIRKPMEISDPPGNQSPRSADIMDRIDPNTADAAALAAIPNLGEKRAAQIVEYRENFHRRYPGATAFSSADDLVLLKGFGSATRAEIAPFLVFGKNHPQ
jgi:DNA uptake protein ComE-like DNA-binding protein